jgi:ankyrin repeat protein
LACKVGCIEIVKYLLEKGAKLDASTMAGKTPISIAVASGHVEIVKFLLSKNPKLHNYMDPVGRNLFIWAAETANIAEETGSETKMIDVLVCAGVDINAEDSAGYNAFDRLCMTNGNVKYAQALIEAGVKFTDEVDKKHPNTSLMIAALNGHAQLCKLLMTKYNCDPRKRSEVILFLIVEWWHSFGIC